jgi:hypothetical protein
VQANRVLDAHPQRLGTTQSYWMASAQLLVLFAVFLGGHVAAAPPQVYRQAAYESPVRGDPDDLLLLAGYGFAIDDTVVYRAVPNTAKEFAGPNQVPTDSTADFGVAPIVSSADVPYTLTIKLPQSMRVNQSYALWVHTARGEWSKAVKINDARPLWLSPAYVYSSGSLASLSRELKIVGRNLRPSPGHSTQIELAGPEQVTGTAIVDNRSSDTLNDYVARIQLPARLAPGRYRVRVNRDGASWVELDGQSLEVLPDEPPVEEFSVGDARFGGCRPDDGADDTACILRAIAAARNAGAASVYFGPGTWDLIDSSQPGLVAGEGIVVAAGVRLRGAGSDLTRLERHAEWNEHSPTAAFTLVGHTLVSGFTFRDSQVYRSSDRAGPYLQLGEDFQRAASAANTSGDAATVSGVVIMRNVFDKPIVAIGSAGLPINRLFITNNTFGAYHSALDLAGNQYNAINQYRIDDSVIDDNVFKPGSKLDLAEKTGTIASELGAGHRVDFSGNTADGSSTDYLYAPDDARGWRAAFFWNMSGNVEEVLVSRNIATCTGDKVGDGEAISFDNQANTFAFDSAVSVVQATAATVSSSASLAKRQNNRDVPVAGYYVGHWVQIVSGPGLGQARKIVGYSTDSSTHVTTFRVAPDWDVVPAPGRTRMAIGREYWQLVAVDNSVDNRQPLCQKSNRSRRKAGAITLWAQSADSVIAGNRQYDSDGIFVQEVYVTPEHPCTDCTMQSWFQSFLDIRANIVEGEYDWATDCSTSGIAIGVGAAPWRDAVPPTVGFGIAISHNAIRHADGQYGGAIAQLNSWFAGPEPHRWPLSDNLIIHHNSIEDIDGARATPLCGKSRARIGIAFPDPGIAWRTVLYANSCKNVSTPLGAGGVDTANICPSSALDSCECPDTGSPAALGLAATPRRLGQY